MTLTTDDLDRIRQTGCEHVDGPDCAGCLFEDTIVGARLVCCEELVENPLLLLKMVSDIYQTNKKFAQVFDKHCKQYKDVLKLKAVIL